MWRRFSLRSRILLIVATLTLLTIGGGLVSLYFTIQTNAFFRQVVDNDLAALEAASRLESALIMQKGYLTYFFQDGDTQWLAELDRWHRAFQEELQSARSWAAVSGQLGMIDQMAGDYTRMVALRERVVDLYKTGNKTEGFDLHRTARREFANILGLAARFRGEHEQRIVEARGDVDRKAGHFINLAVTAMPLAAFLGGLLVYVLLKQVLEPIRQLVQVAAGTERRPEGNEVQALRSGLNHLMADMGQAKTELEASRMRLVQTAKMASVGKLAASVAHSIRNPLTSVKMRLFSLERNLVLSATQREDLTVISEEIRHIDNVLRNFLEFSRRPKLKFQRLSPSTVVDMALDLIRPRLESHGIELELIRIEPLPEIDLDPDQLKEALVNLLVNASEAVGRGGRIVLTESLESGAGAGRILGIRLADNGPGVPPSLRDQIFQPFFSTKDEGTGLGLSIADRIIEEHGGRLEIEPTPAPGTVFVLKLPAMEVGPWTTS